MPSHRARFAAALVVVAGAVTVLAGCSSQTAAAVRVITTAEACQSIHRQISPAELTLKAHLADAKTDPAAYESAMTGLTGAMVKASKTTKNKTVASRTVAVADTLATINTDFANVLATRSQTAVSQLHADETPAKAANAAFASTCGFKP